MKLRHTTTSGEEKIELQMTPMIDIVFQLLVFFIMTFKIVSQEGDFNIKMPLTAAGPGSPDELQVETLRVRMESDGTGKLARVALNGRVLSPLEFDEQNHWVNTELLQAEVVAIIGTDRGPDSLREHAEVELDCDFGLNYSHVIEAITAVSGYIGDDDSVIKLIEKIKFAPPRPVAGG